MPAPLRLIVVKHEAIIWLRVCW